MLRRRPRSRKSRNGVRESSSGSIVISMPRASSGVDSGSDSEGGINSLRLDIVIWGSSPFEAKREAARDANASAFAFAARRTWIILTSWSCASSWLTFSW